MHQDTWLGRYAKGKPMQNYDTDMTETLITLTTDIVAAHVSNNNVDVDDVPTLISNVYSALPISAPEAVAKKKPPTLRYQSVLRSRKTI